MGVMDIGGTECLYDTEKTSDEPPQLIIEHIQYPVDGGGFSRGENYRKDGGSSIGKVAYHMSVDGNSHTPSEKNTQAVSYLADSFIIMDDDSVTSKGLDSRVS